MRVLVSGYYGFGNLGDEALLAGLLAGLRSKGHTPVVLSSNPRATEELHGVEAAHRLHGVPVALARADAVVSGGGGLLQDSTSRRSLDYYLGIISLAKGAGKRVVVYGQSLGPLTAGGRDAVQRALQKVPLALRDEASLRLAAELGLRATLVADPALLLSGGEGSPEPPEAPVLLVPRGGQPALNEALAEVALELSDAGVPVAGMAFHPSEDAAPLAQLKRLVPELEVWEESEPQAAVKRIAGARYVVSVRLHGCILAAAAGVGFAGLSYDPKVKGFLAQAVAPSFEQPVDVKALLGLVLASPPPEEHAVAHLLRLSVEGLDWLGAALTREAFTRTND